MRQFLSTLCCVAPLLETSYAFALKPRTNDASALRVVQHEIQRKTVTDPVARDRLRRRATTGTINVGLDNEETLYFANVSIGTPAQTLRLHIDTGSSDLWVNTPTSKICTYRSAGLCSFAGTYSANSSSTYKYLNSGFSITYADGSGASGDYATDNVQIGGSTLTSQIFAIGYDSSSQQGIMGIGYMANEAVLSSRGSRTYTNVPARMLQQGLISSNAYSLWLNDLDANTGSILFGGVNTDKFTGELSILPIIPTGGTYTAFYIALTALGWDGVTGSFGTNINTAVLLDSGSSLTYLPTTYAQSIFTKLGVTYDSSQGAAEIDCSAANQNHTVEFTFSGTTIGVGMDELVIPIGTTSKGKEVCILGIAPATSSTAVLGDTFLRSAYVVYDLTTNQIAIGKTNFNSTTDNIVEITNSTSSSVGIPSATIVQNAVTAVSTVITGGSINGLGTVSSTAAAPTQPPSRYMQSLGAAGLAAAGAMLIL